MSAGRPGLELLDRVPGFLGEPLRPDTADELLATERIRLELSKPGDGRFKNLGEAETLAIIINRPELAGVFITDDQAAIAKAKAEGVRTYTTFDLVTLAVRAHRLDLTDAWNALTALRAMPRFLPGCAVNFFDFEQRCTIESAA